MQMWCLDSQGMFPSLASIEIGCLSLPFLTVGHTLLFNDLISLQWSRPWFHYIALFSQFAAFPGTQTRNVWPV